MAEAVIEVGPPPPSQTIAGSAEMREALDSSTADRDLNQYLDILGISEKDLGKHVLDLGSGRKERFSREASKRGIKVVSLNPKLAFFDFSREEARREIEGLPPHQGRSVAALATHLPFQDNSFDSIVSLYAIPLYLPKELYEKTFSEIARVLKPLGKAFLAPVHISAKNYLKSIFDKNDNVSYSIEPISTMEGNDTLRITLTKK